MPDQIQRVTSIQGLEQVRVAIIGTRQPDQEQSFLAAAASREVCESGAVITTGGALGIDDIAMQNAAPGHLEVYLPWFGYRVEGIPNHAKITVYNPKIDIEWKESVRRFHPAWQKLSRGAFALHARNYGIIKPSSSVLASLVLAFPNENGEGGTGQGIRIARSLAIPVIEVRRGSLGNQSLSQEAMRRIISALEKPYARI